MTGVETVLPGCDGGCYLGNDHANGTCENQGSSAQLIDKKQADSRENKVDGCRTNGDAKLLFSTINTHSL
jgi:hypothetical protein